MAPVESDGFRLREGEGEGGTDLRRVKRVLILQVSASGRLLGVGGVTVAANSMIRQCCWGWGQSTVSSLGVCVIKRITQYLSLRRSFGVKLDENMPNRRDGVGRKIRAACCPKNMESSGFALCRALEDLVRVVLCHTGRSFGRRPRDSLQRESCTLFVHTDGIFAHKINISINNC